MGLLDMVTGALGGAAGQGGNTQLMDVVTQMLSNTGQQGGLAGLAKMFQDKGMGEQIASWIGTGQNQSVSADQIKNVLGSGQLGQIARQLGMDEQQAAGGLAGLLPQVVDTLTPGGQIPQGDVLEQGLALLKGKLFG
ncbi:MAG: YidB family protein [Gammaproteobacteria bacterium]